MPGFHQRMRNDHRAWVAASLMMALLAGCSSSGFFGAASPPSADSSPPAAGGQRITNFFSGSSANAPQAVVNAQPDVNCPHVEVRQGASTLSIGATGDKSTMSLKYQGSFVRAARECAVVDGNMVMKVGVEGRVVVGPAGGPGEVDVPLRMAVVQETPGGTRPITTKFMRIAVPIGPGNGNVPFTHIEEGLSFPLPTPISLLDNYTVYVGFDPLSAEAQEKQNEKQHSKPRPKPSASAN
jgi:hypothetical protein